jgi:hypothetical protein
MNDRIRELMIEAGYVAPELAPRAQKLVDLVLADCIEICRQAFRDEDIDLSYRACTCMQSQFRAMLNDKQD